MKKKLESDKKNEDSQAALVKLESGYIPKCDEAKNVRIPKGAVKFGGSYYLFIKKQLTSTEAEEHAKSLGRNVYVLIIKKKWYLLKNI